MKLQLLPTSTHTQTLSPSFSAFRSSVAAAACKAKLRFLDYNGSARLNNIFNFESNSTLQTAVMGCLF